MNLYIRNKSANLILIMLLLQLLIGCNTQSSTGSEEQVYITDIQITNIPSNPSLAEPFIFKTSVPNTITLHGTLIVMDPVVMAPSPDDAIFLVPLSAAGDGIATIPPFNIGEVPQAEVDERNGEFIFTNIEPGQYGIVVVTLGGAQVPVRRYSDNSVGIIKVEESDRGSTIELGNFAL